MNKTTILSLIVLIACVIVLSGCSAAQKETVSKGHAQIANPASVYCEEKGGNLEIVTDSTGGQVGMCTLKDGTVCEEWAFFRGECSAEYNVTEKTNDSCAEDNDCETPGNYLMRSSCPYTSKCLAGNCAVVCPKFDGKKYPQVRDCGECPMLSQPSPNFCPDGNIVSGGTDECGCNKPPKCETAAKACTEEAKLCPDGSAVGRTGQNCEFAPCPD